MSEIPGLLLCSFQPFPGTSPHAQKLAQYIPLLARDFSVVVVAGQGGSGPHIEAFHGARVQRVAFQAPDLRSRIEAFERAVKRQVESEQPAVVYLVDPFAGYSVFQQKARFAFKVVFDAQSLASDALLARRKDLGPQSDAVEKIQKRERFCMGHADLVLGVAEAPKALLSLGAREGRVHVHPDGLGPEKVRSLCHALTGRVAPPTFEPSVHEATIRSSAADVDMSDEVTLVDVPILAALHATSPGIGLVDGWYAQLVLGYCPPENTAFARHTPATNFPGRDNSPPPIPPRKR